MQFKYNIYSYFLITLTKRSIDILKYILSFFSFVFFYGFVNRFVRVIHFDLNKGWYDVVVGFFLFSSTLAPSQSVVSMSTALMAVVPMVRRFKEFLELEVGKVCEDAVLDVATEETLL